MTPRSEQLARTYDYCDGCNCYQGYWREIDLDRNGTVDFEEPLPLALFLFDIVV